MKPLTRLNQDKITEFHYQESLWVDEVVRGVFPKTTTFIEKYLKGRLQAAASWILLNYAGFEVKRNRNLDCPDIKRAKKMMIIKSITCVIERKGKKVAEKNFPVGVILKN